MSGAVEVSVVLPAYNEADTIERTVETTLDALADFLPPDAFEVVIAEDGCTDATPDIAARLAREDDRVRHVHAEARLGRGGALRRAFRAAEGETLAYLDTDLATDMRHLERLVELVRSGEADLATGSRWLPGHVVDRPARRGVPSRVYNWLVRLALGSSLRDHQCGFKAFDREALFDLLDEVADDHWFFDTELLVRAQRAGYRVEEFPVEWTPRGDTKVDLVRDVLGMGSQILRTWWQLSVRPRATRRRSVAAGVLLTAAAVALMGLYLPLDEVVAHMGTALSRNPRLVGLAAAVYVLSWPVRGLRYRDILGALGFPERVGFLTGAVFISQTGNLVFPARAGDAVRAYVVKARRAIPYPSGFASLAVERVFDLLTITALAGSTLVGLAVTGSLPALAAGEAIDPVVRSGRTAIVVAGAVGAAAVLAVLAIVATARSERNRVRPLVRRFSDDSYAMYVAGVLERFVGDVQRVAVDPAAFRRVSASSVVIWSIDVATAVAVFAAFGTGLGPLALVSVCLFAVSVGNLAKVLPLSPGGIGLYEGAFTLLVVGVTGIDWQVALGVAVVDHAVKNVVTLAGGVASMLWLNVSLTTAVEEGRDAPSPEAD
ncbi:MAG: flippase-like domain-containing protein [Halobacteriales archaeon]